MWKVVIAVLVLGALGTAMMILITFNQMSEQISVRPGESPALQPPEGTVAVDSEDAFTMTREEASATLINPVESDEKSIARGELAYKRYCLMCHGENMDGFGPVGPSLPARIKPLDGPDLAAWTDGEYYYHLLNGGKVAPPMGLSMTRQERWDVINFIRTKQAENSEN